MHNIWLFLVFLALPLNMLWAQVTPINHAMKNLKLGNTFIYHYQSWDTRGVTLVQDFYFYDKVVRYDTIMSKVYAVFQNGVRERADSSGVYWIPLNWDSTKFFTKEYLRYPLFTLQSTSVKLLNCGGPNFMLSKCFSEDDPILKPYSINGRLDPDSNYYVLGMKVRNFSFSSTGRVDYATILGPWNHSSGEGFYRNLATLCGALIEGKYYGDSACLVASSSPLQAADFTALSPSLAPNPVSDIATLRFLLPTAQGVTIEICDMLGREVTQPLRFDALSSGMNALPIDVTGMARGVYAVRLRTALGLRATTMMVKE